MRSPLFREEVIQARQVHGFGAIRLGRNPSFELVAWIAMALVSLLVAFALWGQVTRRATVPGLLVSALGTLDVTVPVHGVLEEVRVSEGQRVEAGQVLFVLGTDRATIKGPTAALMAVTVQQRLAALDAERAARELQVLQRREALQDRIRRLEVERVSAEQEIGFAQRRASLARRSIERLQQLAQEGFVSESQVAAKQDDWIELQARAETAHRAAAALEREQNSLRSEFLGLAAQWTTDRAQMERTSATLRQESIEIDARKTVTVIAPGRGVVTNVHLPPGAFVQPGQTIATLLSTTKTDSEEASLQADLYAPSRATGLVRPGQTVSVRLAPFPYQKFGAIAGTVLSVARTPTSPKDLPSGQAQALLTASSTQEPLYRVAVKLAAPLLDAQGERIALRPGMTLEASIFVERRTVWEWALSPAIGVAKRL